MKHTQEPWTIDQYGHIFGPYVPMSDAEKKEAGMPSGIDVKRQPHIASVQGKDSKAGDGNRIVDCVNSCAGIENPAAIPDVVEALKELLYTAENADETGYVTDHGFIDMDALFLKARTALAKLEGGSDDA